MITNQPAVADTVAATLKEKETFFATTFIATYQMAVVFGKCMQAQGSKPSALCGQKSEAKSALRRRMDIHGRTLDTLNRTAKKLLLTDIELDPRIVQACKELLALQLSIVARLIQAPDEKFGLAPNSFKELTQAVWALDLILGYTPDTRADWNRALAQEHADSSRKLVSARAIFSVLDNSDYGFLEASVDAQVIVQKWAPLIKKGSRAGKENYTSNWDVLFSTNLEDSNLSRSLRLPQNLLVLRSDSAHFKVQTSFVPRELESLTTAQQKTPRYKEVAESLKFSKSCAITELQATIEEACKWHSKVSNPALTYAAVAEKIREDARLVEMKATLLRTFTKEQLREVLPSLIEELRD